MGMCKGCGVVFSALKMKDGYCIDCHPTWKEEKCLLEEQEKQEEQKFQEYEKKVEETPLFAGIVSEPHKVHGMVSVWGDMITHPGALLTATENMKKLLVESGFDGAVNVRIDSSIENNDKGLNTYTVVMYGDAFTYE